MDWNLPWNFHGSPLEALELCNLLVVWSHGSHHSSFYIYEGRADASLCWPWWPHLVMPRNVTRSRNTWNILNVVNPIPAAKRLHRGGKWPSLSSVNQLSFLAIFNSWLWFTRGYLNHPQVRFMTSYDWVVISDPQRGWLAKCRAAHRYAFWLLKSEWCLFPELTIYTVL